MKNKEFLIIILCVSWSLFGFTYNNISNADMTITETSNSTVIVKRDLLNGTYSDYHNITNPSDIQNIISLINNLKNSNTFSEYVEIIPVPGDPIIVEIAEAHTMHPFTFYSNGWVKYPYKNSFAHTRIEGAYAKLENIIIAKKQIQLQPNIFMELYRDDGQKGFYDYFRVIDNTSDIANIQSIIAKLDKCPTPIEPSSSSTSLVLNVVQGTNSTEYRFSNYAQISTRPQLYKINDWDLDVLADLMHFDAMYSAYARIETIDVNPYGDLMRLTYYTWEYDDAKSIKQIINSAAPVYRMPTEVRSSPIILLTLMNPTRTYYKLYPDGIIEQQAKDHSLYYKTNSKIYDTLYDTYWPYD